jgi:hypothetical protein
MTNETAMTNDETPRLRHCLFVIHSSFGLRHSPFEFGDSGRPWQARGTRGFTKKKAGDDRPSLSLIALAR